jgi:hypothetical protein
MNKGSVVIGIVIGLTFVLGMGYFLFKDDLENDSETCISSSKWQLKNAYLDSFLYIIKPGEVVPPKLLSRIDISKDLIGEKQIQLELDIEARGFGMYGDAKITYANTPYNIRYSASATGSRHSSTCKKEIELNFGKWYKNDTELFDNTQYIHHITIKNKYSKNFEGIYSFRNDSLFSEIGYNAYDHDSTFYKYIDLENTIKYKGGNKTLRLIWIKIEQPNAN